MVTLFIDSVALGEAALQLKVTNAVLFLEAALNKLVTPQNDSEVQAGTE